MRTVVQKDLQELRTDRERLNRAVKNADERYKEINQDLVSLDELKKAKENQLSYFCNQAILKGFKYTTVTDNQEFRFSYDVEAQLNFQGVERLMSDGKISEVMWTAYDSNENVVRIKLVREDFNTIILVILQHKDDNVSKFRDFLMPMVNAAETKEEVDSINW